MAHCVTPSLFALSASSMNATGRVIDATYARRTTTSWNAQHHLSRLLQPEAPRKTAGIGEISC
ncbi:hypothetical protein CHELA40_13772 [Chelatococcus asaccharovorans]|nr:hypothetical protein CHELA40_13772 [Chelatococcus asaccharovorans]CAH1675740.1 hypothetical protein CHELA17_61854 [Chelatococcus asaccharovorans]